MNGLRTPAVAGLFYPDEPRPLRAAVDRLLQGARLVRGGPPAAMIQPHAGYDYSGEVAATGYRRLGATRSQVDHVIVLGPNHTVPLRTIAVSAANEWLTPLGRVVISERLRDGVLDTEVVSADDGPHRLEHAIEVHLPVLQRVLEPGWELLPLIVGDVDPSDVAAALDACWGPNDLVIVSSDLSHYHSYAEARDIDEITVEAITTRSVQLINARRACGSAPMRGLLATTRLAAMSTEVLDVRNSGDTAGDRHRVVGYASIAFVAEAHDRAAVEAESDSAGPGTGR